MTELSDAAEVLVLDWILGTGTPTRPAGHHLGLSTGSISDSETGSNFGGSTEISGNGYARQDCAFNAATSGAGTADNAALETFSASGGNWGTIAHFALCDAATLGGMIVFSPMTNSRIINDGDDLEFAAGSIVITAA